MEAIILTKKTRPLVWYPKAYENELFTELNQLENSKSPYIIKVHFWLNRGCKFKCKKETENTNYQIINKKAGKTRNRKIKLKKWIKKWHYWCWHSFWTPPYSGHWGRWRLYFLHFFGIIFFVILEKGCSGYFNRSLGTT